MHSKVTHFKPALSNRLLWIIRKPGSSSRMFFSEEVSGLLIQGANPQLKTAEGETLLHVLIKSGPKLFSGNDEHALEKKRVILHLTNHGADLLAFDSDGKSPWYYAVKQPDDELSKYYVAHILSLLQHERPKLKGKENVLHAEVREAMEATMVDGKPHFLVANVLEQVDKIMAPEVSQQSSSFSIVK